MSSISSKYPQIVRAIKSLGIVFGDIGTSPIYTLTVIFSLIPVTQYNVLGALSLIVWTLILLVSIQYAWLAMSITHKGEGGTIVLKELLTPFLTTKFAKFIVSILAFLGISFFFGDGVITPAISILSAVEGLALIPGMPYVPQFIVMGLAAIITIILFSVQKRGTDKIASLFGPLMLVWFTTLGVTGLWFIIKHPVVLNALNPYYGIHFLFHSKLLGFLLLSKVILCATGAEALYSDMGHLGRVPIIHAWIFAFVCLMCTYLGQGAFLLENRYAQNVLFEMILYKLSWLYIPFLLLSVAATIVASQASISGIFSIIYQAITTRVFPRLYVEYTSSHFRSQIYIPSVNWFLLSCVLFAIVQFRSSLHLASAYGLAASGTMTITALLLTWLFIYKKDTLKLSVACIIVIINIAFFISNLQKIVTGAYWSLLFAAIPLSIILIYTSGQRRLSKVLRPLSIDEFVHEYTTISSHIPYIPGAAIFFSRKSNAIPTYIAHTMLTNNIMYEDNIIVTVITQDTPFGITASFKQELAPRLRMFEIKVGYMEIPNIENILHAADIHSKTIFYGVEEISTSNIVWKIFTIIKKLTPSFVQFYKLPAYRLHGVMVRVRM
jgi:KUP system potassium uptake protein